MAESWDSQYPHSLEICRMLVRCVVGKLRKLKARHSYCHSVVILQKTFVGEVYFCPTSADCFSRSTAVTCCEWRRSSAESLSVHISYRAIAIIAPMCSLKQQHRNCGNSLHFRMLKPKKFGVQLRAAAQDLQDPRMADELHRTLRRGALI